MKERHTKQLAVMRGWLEGRSFFSAARAMELVRNMEQGTRKDGKTPKFHHQLSVARLLATLLPHFPYENLKIILRIQLGWFHQE